MLVYVDESGFPDPRDKTLRPVLAAVCLAEKRHRKLGSELYKIKKAFFKNPQRELKATELLRAHVFENRPQELSLVESVFELVRETNLAVFACIMEKPSRMPEVPAGHLPIQYRYLFQRINLYMVNECGPEDLAILVFDGDGTAGIKGGLGPGVSNYLYRSAPGQSYSQILPTPFFVDSRITPGIQLADMVAGCIRHWHEKGLQGHTVGSDSFTSALIRYYKTIRSKTYDFPTDTITYYGLCTIAERYLYQRQADKEGEETNLGS